jgi:hypothetical protein
VVLSINSDYVVSNADLGFLPPRSMAASPEQTCIVKLIDRDVVIDKLVYTATNPVQDHLVERVHHWPSVNGLRAVLAGQPLRDAPLALLPARPPDARCARPAVTRTWCPVTARLAVEAGDRNIEKV